jgi:hypothetical protein
MSRNTVLESVHHREKHFRSYVILFKLKYILCVNGTRSDREIQPFKSNSTGQMPVLVPWGLHRC